MSNSVCMLHTDRRATAPCAECGRPLCQECIRIVADKPVCETCLTAIRSRVAMQLNAEAAAASPAAQPQSGSFGAAGQTGPAPPYVTAPQAPPPGSPYAAPPGSPYPTVQQPYGVQPAPAYSAQRGQQQQSGGPAPYGASPAPYGQAPQQPPPAYNPYGTPAQPYPQQPGAYNPQGAAPQPYPPQQAGHQTARGPYGTLQPGRPLSAPSPEITTGNYLLGGVLGAIAAVIGGGIYIAVVLATKFSIGYMALAVGFMVGWAVKLGTRTPSKGAGIMAMVLAILGILPCEILTYSDPSSLLFTALFLFIGCRWAYAIAAGGRG